MPVDPLTDEQREIRELVRTLSRERIAPRAAEIDKTAVQHGHDLHRQGLTLSQVVHDYGDVCQAITELAVETGTGLDVVAYADKAVEAVLAVNMLLLFRSSRASVIR